MAKEDIHRKGNRRIPDSQWLKFIGAIADNRSQVAAAEIAGISYSTVMEHKQNPASNLNRLLGATGVKEEAGVFAADKVKDPNALRALNDIGFFRSYYFARSSSPWVEEATEKIMKLLETPNKEYAVVNICPGVGKALDIDTPIPTPSGWTRMRHIQVGDEVFDEAGKVCRVTNKSEVFYNHDCYEVTTDDGHSVIADADHQWQVRISGHGQYGKWKKVEDYKGKTGPKPSPDGRQIYTTEKLAKVRSKKPQLQMAQAIEMPDVVLPIEPYTLGIWLGDGHSAGARITAHPDDAPHIVKRIEDAGFSVNQKGYMLYSITGSKPWAKDGLHQLLRANDLINNKFIPREYFRSSIRQRMALLQGLIDSDGYVSLEGAVEFCSMNYWLAEGVQRIVLSLGVKASLKEGRATLNGKDCGTKYRVHFYMKDAASLPRKANNCQNGVRTPSRYLTVTKLPYSVPTQCIEVDSPNHLYLAGYGFMVTHNSTFFTHDLPVWLAVRDRARRTMIGSRTANQANKYTGRIRRTLERTTPSKADSELFSRGIAQDAKSTLIKDFGRFKPTNSDRWRIDEFYLAQESGDGVEDKEPNFASYGMDSGFLGGRFNTVIWDDLVDRTNTKTAEARENLRELWETAMENRLEPSGLLLLVGQRIASDDLYRYALDQVEFTEEFEEQPEKAPRIYHHIVYKAHYDELCGKDAKGNPTHKGAYPNGCLIDDYRLPWKEIGRLQKNRANRFELTYQQEDVDTVNALVKQEWIDGGTDSNGVFHRGCWDEDRNIGNWPKNLNAYSVMTVDPSPTKYWGCIWWGYNAEDKNQHVCDIKRAALTAPEFLDWDATNKKFVGLIEEWWLRSNDQGHPIQYLIFEENAAQRWLTQMDVFRRWSSQRGVSLVRHQTNRNKSNEDYGVQMLAPEYEHGRVRFPGKDFLGSKAAMRPMIKELLEWTPDGGGATSDLVMSHWFLLWNAPTLFDYNQAKPPQFKRPSWLAGRSIR